MICFVPERISGLKLFVFSSYSNPWELANSIRLSHPISSFLKFVYLMAQLSSSSRISEFRPFLPIRILYDFTFYDIILL